MSEPLVCLCFAIS